MRIFTTTMLSLAATLIAASSRADTVVRVRPTPGGPQIHLDGRPVIPRWFFGTVRGGQLAVDAEWRDYSFEVTPQADVPGRGTLHFRFGQSPGDIWLAEVRVYDVESGRDVLPLGTFHTSAAFERVWNLWPLGADNTVGRVAIVDGAVHVTLQAPPNGKWPDFHLHSDIALSFTAGRRYRCSFRARAEPKRSLRPALYHVSGGVWTPIGGPPGPFLHQVELARDAGVRFISFGAPNCWTASDRPIDFTPIDALCQSIIEVHPTALLVPRVSANAPPWWLQRHPEAAMQYEGDVRGTYASVSDLDYRRAAAVHLEKLCRHLDATFPDHFAGIHPAGQNTGEWFYQDTWKRPLSGYDVATRAAWRRWLSARGVADADGAEPPSPQSRHAAPFGLLRDPARERRLIDFARFQQEEMADMVLALAAAARRGTEGRKLVVFFYGYHYEFGALPNGAPVSGHYGLHKVLRSRDIDILCSPISYTDRQCPGTAPCMSPAESIRDAGIMWLNEDDTRTFLSAQRGYGATADLQQTQAVMIRNTAQAAIRGFATWWMDLPGQGWYDDARIWDVMRWLHPLDEELRVRRRPFTPDIAAIVGEDSMCHIAGGGHALTRPLVYDARAALGRSGAPYGQYTLAQAIAGRVPAKLQVFLAAWSLSPEHRRDLKRNRTPGTTRVWCYAPGYLLPDRADVEAMSQVTGFRHRRVRLDSAIATPTAIGRQAGLREPWGPQARIEPLFTAEADDAEVWARWSDGAPALLVRRTREGNDVFLGVPQLTPELVRALARLGGVRIFTDRPAAVWAHAPFLSIHAVEEGDLTIDTGSGEPISDALTGKTLGSGPRVVLAFRAGESRVLRY